MRAHDLTARSVASRGFVASPCAVPLGHHISFSRVLLSCLYAFHCASFEIQQLVFTIRLSGHSPHLNTPIAYPEPLDLLRLLRQMRPSCRQGFHQPELPHAFQGLLCVFCGATFLVTHRGAAPLPMWRSASVPTKSAPSRISCSALRMGRAHRSFMLVSCSD